MIIVDTNVVSEMMKTLQDVAVQEWVERQVAADVHTTSISVAEIKYGIARLPEGRRKELLRLTADHTFDRFAAQILPFDVRAAEHYSGIVASRDEVGAPIDGFDAQIAAICCVHGATLATRNIKDFRETGVRVVNPWLVEQKQR